MFFVCISKATDEYSRIRIRNHVYGSKYSDPFQNITDPEHCVTFSFSQRRASSGSVHIDSPDVVPHQTGLANTV